MKEEIDPTESAEVIKRSDEPQQAFIRTNESEYTELGLKGKDLTVEDLAEIAAKYPN